MRPSALVLALAAALAAACSGAPAARSLPDERLPTLGGVQGPSLASCPTDKCLTVLVAPWCSICRAEAPNIVVFRRWLGERGVASRVVVGLSDDPEAIKGFARTFGADAMLDERGVLSSRGVPLFLVTDRRGLVLKAVPGFPRVDGPEALARYLELI